MTEKKKLIWKGKDTFDLVILALRSMHRGTTQLYIMNNAIFYLS